MRKTVQVLIALVLVLMLTACGEGSSQAVSASAQAEATDQAVSEESGNDTQEAMNETKDTANMEIRSIPSEYKAAASQAGRVERFDYSTAAEDKYAFVYLPYGYSETQSYDILYMMHGGGGSQGSLFDGEGESNDIKNTIDHLIENGEMQPVIIVAPTFYTKAHGSTSVSGSWDAVLEFPDELVEYLMPAVESAYSTYANSADDGGFRASRDHRAFGGFSMGSVTTWYVFQQEMDYFGTYIPISGDSWAVGMQGGRSNPEETAKALTDSVAAQGFAADDFMIYAITGSEDIAEPCMTPMVEAMKAYPDVFRMNGDINTFYYVKDGGVHNMTYVKEYLYNLLPVIYGGNK